MYIDKWTQLRMYAKHLGYSVDDLAQHCKTSTGWVRKVVRGDETSRPVIQSLVDLLGEEAERILELKQQKEAA